MSAQTATLPTWTHSDSDGGAEMARALDVKSFRTKPDGSAMTTLDRVRLVRALACATAYAVDSTCDGAPAAGEAGQLKLGSDVRADRFRTRADCYAASTIARTWQLFADPGRHIVSTAVTRDGDPAVLTPEPTTKDAPTDVAFPPILLGVIIVVAIAAYASAICYVGQTAAEIIDRKLTDDALTERLVKTQAQAVGLVNDHTERQRAANRPLAWDPVELKVLDSLLATQQQIAARTGKPLPNPFTGAVEGAREVGKKIAEVGMDLGFVAALAGGAYVLMK